MTNSFLVLCNSFILKQSKKILCAFFKKGENVDQDFEETTLKGLKRPSRMIKNFFRIFRNFFKVFQK